MTHLLSSSFRGRSVFVTGHTGFKGSWLCLWLHRLGAKVTGYSLAPPTQPSHFDTIGLRELLTGHYEADVRDAACLERALHQANPEIVFHLAAQPLVRESYAHPLETFETNIMGTAALLNAVRTRQQPCVVVIVVSDKCYHNSEQVWGYREVDPLGGDDPYSASKAAAEIVTASYRASFFPLERLATHRVKVASTRAGNVFGGGDWARYRIVPDAARSLGAGQPILVRNPGAIRPWQHVLNPLSGYMLLAARMLSSDDPVWCSSWNFGPMPGEEVPVAELMDLFVSRWGAGCWREAGDPTQPRETGQLRLCIDRAVSILGWRPCWGLKEAVGRTARWYRKFYSEGPEGMREIDVDEIAAYEAAMAEQSPRRLV